MSREEFMEAKIQRAKELAAMGYVGVSNKYRIIVRIDRPDWAEVMAKKYNRAVADFFVMNENGPTDSTGHWGEHYASTFSKDHIEGIDPYVYMQLKRMTSVFDLRYVPVGATTLMRTVGL